MNKVTQATLAAMMSLTSLTSPAQASDYLVGYVGYFDITQDDDYATQFGVEYRLSPLQYGFRPMVGFNVTTDGSTYTYGGFSWDIGLLNNQIYIIPNFAIGGYSEGDGKDLGGGLEFRSGIELNYVLANDHRIGVAFNHISNASIYDKNPGAETLLINYQVPVGNILR